MTSTPFNIIALAEYKERKKYAAGEFLAHNLAYEKLSDSSIQRVLEVHGSYNEYQCMRLKTSNAGLVGYILVPTQTSTKTTPEIKVVFRGTDFTDSASWKRNLESTGAGSRSMAADRDLIMHQVNAAIKDFQQTQNSGKPIRLAVAGHSLGGADAQNFFTDMLQAISQNHGLTPDNDPSIPAELRDQFNAIEKLQLFALNSTGARDNADINSSKYAEFLAIQCTMGATKVTIDANYQLVHGDGVQQTGNGMIFANVPAEHVNVGVLKAHTGYGGHMFNFPITASALLVPAGLSVATGGLTTAIIAAGSAVATAASIALGINDTSNAHTQHIHKTPMSVECLRLTNDTAEGQQQIHQELNNKSWWLGTTQKVVYGGYGLLSTTAGMFFNFGSKQSAPAIEADVMTVKQAKFT